MLLMSCNSDPCEDVVCGQDQDCEEGICKCKNGLLLNNNGVCTRDNACFNFDCGTNGTCFEHTVGVPYCSCDDGYEWDNSEKCNQVIRDKFLGTWMGTHTVWGTTSSAYTINIVADSEVSNATVSNIMDLDCPDNNDIVEMTITFKVTGHEHSYNCATFDSNVSSPIFMYLAGNDTLNLSLNIVYNQGGSTTLHQGVYIRQ